MNDELKLPRKPLIIDWKLEHFTRFNQSGYDVIVDDRVRGFVNLSASTFLGSTSHRGGINASAFSPMLYCVQFCTFPSNMKTFVAIAIVGLLAAGFVAAQQSVTQSSLGTSTRNGTAGGNGGGRSNRCDCSVFETIRNDLENIRRDGETLSSTSCFLYSDP